MQRFAPVVRQLLHRLRNGPTPPPADADTVAFQCNLCGADNRVAAALLSREVSSCGRCGSTVRFRSIVQLLVRELFGEDIALPRLAPHREIRGIGLTDSGTYAAPLAARFDYTNTRFDGEPHLDITDVPAALAGKHRFVISSDVFEHVAPPVHRAFQGARRLLADDGILVLTVPFSLAPANVEHFPELYDYRIEGAGEGAVLHNVTRDGRRQRFDRLVFHGGVGATLEMREFSRDGIARELAAAGFSRIRFCEEPCPRFGIVWQLPWSIPVVARAS